MKPFLLKVEAWILLVSVSVTGNAHRMSSRLEIVRQEACSRRIRREEEDRVRRVRRVGQGRLEICAEVVHSNRRKDIMPPSSYRSGQLSDLV